MSTSRIEALKPGEGSEQVRALLGGSEAHVAELEGRMQSSGGPPNILYTIAHHEALLQPFLGFASALALHGVLPRRDSELLALRAAWNCRSAFEWGHHVLYGRAAGLSDAEIERVCDGPDAYGWSSDDRVLLRAADELHDHKQISDITWHALRARFDTAQLVELPFVVGQYTMLSMVANATGVVCEADLPPLPERRQRPGVEA